MEENFLSVDKYRDYTIYGKFWKMEVSILSILSDLKNVLLYDRVYILNQGSIIESGSPQ
jgi:ABC-type multidrug transport system fused ATPase/permease subunit